MATKADLVKLAEQLAKALRIQAKYRDMPDATNCWCGGEHMESVACNAARRALKRYSLTVNVKHEG